MSKRTNNTNLTALRMPATLREKIEQIADDDGLNFSDVMRRAAEFEVKRVHRNARRRREYAAEKGGQS